MYVLLCFFVLSSVLNLVMPSPGSFSWVPGLHHWLFLLLHFLVSTFSFNPPLIPCALSLGYHLERKAPGFSHGEHQDASMGMENEVELEKTK